MQKSWKSVKVLSRKCEKDGHTDKHIMSKSFCRQTSIRLVNKKLIKYCDVFVYEAIFVINALLV